MASKESGRLIPPAAAEHERGLAAALAELQAEQEWAIRERQEAEAAGVPALQRLVKAAQGSSGQCRHVRGFLLGLYNAVDWPFDLTRLRALDRALQADCLAVLRMDMNPRCEVHGRIEDGQRIFEAMREREREAVEE